MKPGTLPTLAKSKHRLDNSPPAKVPAGRKKIAQGKESDDDALGPNSKNTPSPERAEDLPSLPPQWRWTRLEELASDEPNSITDGPFGSKLKTEHYTTAGPRVVRLQNIGDGNFVDAGAHISHQHFLSLRKHEVHAGDVVIAALGESPPRACVIPPALG